MVHDFGLEGRGTSNYDEPGWQWDAAPMGRTGAHDDPFAPIVDRMIQLAQLHPCERVLDIGAGAASAASAAALVVGGAGEVSAIDVSHEVFGVEPSGHNADELENVRRREGRAEALPAVSGHYHAVLAPLSLMYVPNRAAAAREIARVLRPGGRFVAAAWSDPRDCEAAQFQHVAGEHAQRSSMSDVGPESMADPMPFLIQLAHAGVDARCETETTTLSFDTFESAWDALVGDSTALLDPDRRERARQAARRMVCPDGDGPCHFRNLTQFIIGRRRS